MAEYKILTREDIPAHDDQAKDLIIRMGEYGWTGKLSSRGHAIMRAPDGVTTHSISRDSKRARSGRNSLAQFERWLKEQEASRQVEEDSKPEFTCGICHQEFKNGRALGAHRNKHYPAVPCPMCGKPVKYMERHMRTHEDKEPEVNQITLSQKLLELATQVEQLEQQILEGD